MAVMTRFAFAILSVAAAQQPQKNSMNPFAAFGGDDMVKGMCNMLPVPGMCKAKNTGHNAPDCQKNPGACCPAAVRKCSDTSVDSFLSSVCPKSMGAGAKCVGSDVFSPEKVGVCMCSSGNTCRGSNDDATCSAGFGQSVTNAATNLMNGAGSSFNRLYEDDVELPPAKPELNIGGFITLGIYGGSVFLVTALAIRGFRRFNQPTYEAAGIELLSQDEEARE